MSDTLYPVTADWAARAWIDDKGYQSLYDRSITDPEGNRVGILQPSPRM